MSKKMLKNMSLKVSLLCLSVLSVAAYGDLNWSQIYVVGNEQNQNFGAIFREARTKLICLANYEEDHFIMCSNDKLMLPNNTIHGIRISNLSLSIDQTQTEFENAIAKSNLHILRQDSFSTQ